MGAWGEGPFDNDTAADWSAAFADVGGPAGIELVEEALRAAAETGEDDYLESHEGALALAAAELVAAVRGMDVERSPYNRAALAWVAASRPDAGSGTVSLAVGALERVLAPESELVELWEDAGTATWRPLVEDRLRSLRALR
jgi:hypothetical protein